MNNRQKVLFNQLQTYRNELLDVIDGMTDKEAEFIPTGFNNNVHWNLGHIYLDQYLWIQALTKEKMDIPNIFHSSFGFGTSPKDFTAETPSMIELKKLLSKQPNDIQQTYGDRLNEPFPPIDMEMCTIEQVLIRTIFHEGMHLQAIMDIKKSL
ncbi:DinB family protein [Pseudogracilibacillus auburnensis]|uniref:DinB family protein n=1 Tax=Pseudogracilibacillus auburnensis TaxID=1494959 RepID=UPI001A97676B|nr:DinB family protein [Pseudogracilibacillus auburnensis]MBO1001369.1 DinB family protein [Pseudogracilibacillus auburnensis]